MTMIGTFRGLNTDATFTNVTDGMASSSLAIKTYVDNVASGRDWKESCRAATTTTLPANTYNNGTAGVGATLTGNANGALAAIDGVTLVANNRVLVQDEATAANNGIYVVTQVGTAGTPYILTRATDANSASNITAGMTTTIEEGTVNADLTFTLITNNPITVGTTALDFTMTGGGGGSASSLTLTPIPGVDLTASGITGSVTVDTNAVGIGAALFLAADGRYDEADADAAATMPCTAVALETSTGTKSVLFHGFIRNDAWNWTPGGTVYVSTTQGTFTQTAPSGSGDQIQAVGVAQSADVIYFNPSMNFFEVP